MHIGKPLTKDDFDEEQPKRNRQQKTSNLLNQMEPISEREELEDENSKNSSKRKRTPSPKRTRRRKDRKKRRFQIDSTFNNEEYKVDKKEFGRRSQKKRESKVAKNIDFFELQTANERLTFGKLDTRKPVYKSKKPTKVQTTKEITNSQYANIKDYLDTEGNGSPGDQLNGVLSKSPDHEYRFRPRKNKKTRKEKFSY